MTWTCSRGQTYTEWEMELGMLEDTLFAQMEQGRLAHEENADLAHEHKLARAWLTGELQTPWPWYADIPYEIEMPEIVWGHLVDIFDEYDDAFRSLAEDPPEDD